MLKDGKVGLVPWQRDWGDVHQALGAVVVKNLQKTTFSLTFYFKDDITDIETGAVLCIPNSKEFTGPAVFGSEQRNTTIGLKILLF